MGQENTLTHIFFGGGSFLSSRVRMFVCLIPVVMMGLGARHFTECPKEPLIPIYLLVGGGASLLLQVLPVFYCTGRRGAPNAFCRLCNFLLYFFCFIWLIGGSVVVYKAYLPDFEDERSKNYCERILYLVTMWFTSAIHIFIVAYIIFRISASIYEEYFE